MPPVNESDFDWTDYDEADASFRRKHLSAAAHDGDGDPDLGCSLYELPPGGRSWPFHYHEGNAEALYVLAGDGLLRVGDDATDLTPGDYVPLPPGDPGHRVVNDSENVLRYLAVSTMRDPDVVVYPEMDTVGVYAGSPPGGRSDRDVHGYWRRADAVDYWD